MFCILLPVRCLAYPIIEAALAGGTPQLAHDTISSDNCEFDAVESCWAGPHQTTQLTRDFDRRATRLDATRGHMIAVTIIAFLSLFSFSLVTFQGHHCHQFVLYIGSRDGRVSGMNATDGYWSTYLPRLICVPPRPLLGGSHTYRCQRRITSGNEEITLANASVDGRMMC